MQGPSTTVNTDTDLPEGGSKCQAPVAVWGLVLCTDRVYGRIMANDDDELTPEQEAELTQVYGPDGPEAFRKNVELLRTLYPDFFGE